MHELGSSRSASRRDYLLQTPDTFVRTGLPGLSGGAAIVHIAPVGGAGFAQWTAEFEDGGTLSSSAALPSSSPSPQRFVYVLEGSVNLELPGTWPYAMAAGGYAYIPSATEHVLRATTPARLAVIEKRYEPLDAAPVPGLSVGQESAIAPAPLLGDPDVLVRALLPEDAGFDFAVNTMTYQPGAALAMVEVHVMEHGLLMLEGGGIYRLGGAWHPVAAGDFIWMAPFCPQWFGALGKKPAKYLIYKNWNRHPLT